MTLTKSRLPNLPTFPRLFDDFFKQDFLDWGIRNHSFTNTTIPSVNILENKDGFAVEMAAPGMDKKDFLIELNNETLTISSQKQVEDSIKGNERYARCEFSYQSFQRTFHLPKTVVDESKIKAKYEDGILRVVIPKKESAKPMPPRNIDIQ